MCKDCGCGKKTGPAHSASRPHRGTTSHSHPPKLELVQIQRTALADNETYAAQNRHLFEHKQTVALNIISSPGAGKTTLLEQTLNKLRGRVRCAVIAGDVQTDRDARRLEGRGAHVRQIETRGACHLDAKRVGKALPSVLKQGVKLLFIENVGNLVCPAAYDLGETMKIVLLSTAEGEDKPLKYPAIFSAASVAVITKTDLIPALDWDRSECLGNLRKVQPRIRIFELSSKTCQGMDEWIDFLVGLVKSRSSFS